MARVTYSCFAVPPEGIIIGKIYDTGTDEKGSYYADEKEKIYADKEFINMIFSTIVEKEAKRK